MGRRVYRRLGYRGLGLFLALLLLAASVMPTTARAEAQMRCVGASSRSAPCAHADIPAGLTEKQVYSTLMSCCRSMPHGCAMKRGCPMQSQKMQSQEPMASHWTQGLSSSRHCLVSVRAVTVPTTLASSRARWLLTAAPALAPPAFALACLLPSHSTLPAFRPDSPILPLLLAPRLHGLRAPPAA